MQRSRPLGARGPMRFSLALIPFFAARRVQLANLASHHSIPATYAVREIVEAGGLMSYGSNLADAFSSGRPLRRPCSQGREACGLARRAVGQVRAGHQRSDGQDARPRSACDSARPRRRGHRMIAMLERRQFIALLGGAVAAWPMAARAQQAAMPVIGFLYTQSAAPLADRLRGFHHGLKEIGYVEGENVVIVYGWAEGQSDRLPVLAGELVRRQVAVIVAAGPNPALAAKAATTTIPIVFAVSQDPVRLGLVASLTRPCGNVTGINFVSRELAARRLELLREMVPGATRVAVLVNPANATSTDSTLKDVQAAARSIGLQIQIFNASTSREIDVAFAALVRADRCPLRQPRWIFLTAGEFNWPPWRRATYFP